MTDLPGVAPLALLQTLSFELARAPDAESAARAIVRAGRRVVGGVSSVLWLVDSEGALDLIASDGVPEDFLSQWRRVLPSDNEAPAIHAVRLGEPLWVSTADRYRDVDHEIARRAREANRPLAFAALPLRFEGLTLGVLVFGFEEPHPFTEDEKTLALSVAGHAAQALERARLQAAQLRALAGLRVIAKVGEMVTTASLDIDATLTALARAVVPDVADWCVVDMFSEGNVRRLTAHHTDPAKVTLARDYAARFPSRLDDPSSSLARIMQTGAPVWVRRITREMVSASIADHDQREILLSLGLRSSVQVPLVSEGRVRGVVTFIMSESGREYDETDRDLVIEVGRRAGHAVTNASLYAREQRARERVTRLASVTAELARASTAAEVGEVACREGAAALGAQSAAVYAVEPHRLRRLARFSNQEDAAADSKTYLEIPLGPDLPITRAVRTKEVVVIESQEQLLREFPALVGRDLNGSELAIMCKPLADREGRVVGVLAFAFSGPRTFAEDERAFARTLANHCAQAFDRARILDLERTARDRLALLAAAGDAFAATIDYDTTLATVVRLALPTLGDFAFFDVVEEDGSVRRTSGAHDDPEVARILADSRWQKSERTDVNLCALSTGESAIHPAIDDAFLRDMATSEEHLAVLRRLQLCSMVTVPVVLRGNVIGALTLCHGRSGRHHSSDDMELARELARRGATAVDQARLYRSATEAARRAEEANRVKDEFLATVSHELRTPLNAILGWAHLLDGERLDDREFLTRGLAVVRRNAHAQREIIEDILDVARIITGKLRLEVASLDLSAVVRDAVDVVRPGADAKGVVVDTHGLDAAIPCLGDRARLQQVVWNLLSNALKFTTRGGRIDVNVTVDERAITIRVTDDGVGIAGDLLPFVFDRFRQGDSSTTRTHGGLGLGLSIVRHLVELHGGTVSAASGGPGAGAAFEVVLPTTALSDRRPPAVPPAQSSRAVALPSLHAVNVLVVDDVLDSSEVVAVLLQEAGATVRRAASADEAIEAFEHEMFDVVLSDISMPDVDGYALLGMLQRRAGELHRPLRAIALTAHSRREDRENAAKAGFVAHLSKPVDPREVLATVTRVVATTKPAGTGREGAGKS